MIKSICSDKDIVLSKITLSNVMGAMSGIIICSQSPMSVVTKKKRKISMKEVRLMGCSP